MNTGPTRGLLFCGRVTSSITPPVCAGRYPSDGCGPCMIRPEWLAMEATSHAGGQPAPRPPTARGVLDRRTVSGYALGSVATGTFGTVPGLVLLFFLTDTLAVPAAVAGLAVFVPKFFDVLWNPAVGSWSDRTTSRWGPRRPWMLAGGVTLPLLFVLVFTVPDLGPAAPALWVCLACLLSGAAYGLSQVPYFSLPAELPPRPEERPRLQTAR